MTPPDLRALCDSHGGPQALARKLGVGKDWLYRRLTGKTRIRPKDVVFMKAALKGKRPKLRG